ncbi:MAG: glycosyltransferase family 2 protein [Cyclobacteriaceae bacterium]|nr:glycosyltransferase family 2 protein [Cyclobacteriaceae bacterium]
MEWDWLNWFTYLGIIYAVMYTGSKLIFSVMSLLEIRVYFWRYDHIIEEHELNDHLRRNKHDIPLISIISPAYNEGVLIIDTVSSFLNQSYRNKEVIICSDGGTDNTLEKLIEHFELVEVPDTFNHSPHITHKPIKRYLRSSNPSYRDLLVIDKENGGKADAQNAGVAIARGEIVTIIDADSILEKYALIHLADIFEREGRVIGIGTPIGVVNDCNIGPDGVDDASVPKSFWAKIQVIEYLRSFLLGRMFAQRYRGLQIVSGAFGVYKKWILEAVGGYSTGSLAEDMDIDGKIWRYIDTNKLKYRIRYIPEAFCWSEVPNTLKSLASQRDRWARGMTETIWKNRELFFNPKYKMLGLFSYPYYVFFEWLTPFIEIIGLLYFIIGASLGWFSFLILEYIFIAYWVVGIILNISALSAEALTRGHYKNRGTLLRLSLFAIIEPLFYHWINSYLYVAGNLRMLFGKRGWGNMERVGLKKNIPVLPEEPVKPAPAVTQNFSIPGVSAAEVKSNGNGASRKETDSFINEVERQRAHEDHTDVQHKSHWIYISIIGTIALAGSFYLWLELQNNQDEAYVMSEAPVMMPMKIDSAQHSMNNRSSDSIKFSDTNPDLTGGDLVEPVAPMAESSDSSKQSSVGSIHTLTEKTGYYYLIVASVKSNEFTQNYAEQLSKEGYQCTIIPKNESRSFNLIAADKAVSLEEAITRKHELKSTFGDDIWIRHY